MIKDLHRRGSRVLEKLDERDIETDLNGLVEIRDGFLYAEGEGSPPSIR
jgi:hypothetical protein